MKPLPRLPLCPLTVTVTATGPALPAGVVAVIVVEFTTTTLVAAAVPKVTVAPVAKFVPVMVTEFLLPTRRYSAIRCSPLAQFGPPEGVRNATICMIHCPEGMRRDRGVAARRAHHPVFGDVAVRRRKQPLVNPLPGPLVMLVTMFAPKIRSVALVVVAAPLLLRLPFPLLAAVTSTGLLGSAPLYSRIRMSGYAAAVENVNRDDICASGGSGDIFGVIDGL